MLLLMDDGAGRRRDSYRGGGRRRQCHQRGDRHQVSTQTTTLGRLDISTPLGVGSGPDKRHGVAHSR